MRILSVSSLWPPAALGGAETYAARLARELTERGHEVGVLTRGVPGPDVVAQVSSWPYRLDEYVGQPAWKRAAFHGRDLYDPVSAVVVRRAMREFRPDVVHSHSVAGLSTAALTAPSAVGVPHVHHLHDYWLLCQRTSFTRGDGMNCERRCTACVAFRTTRSALLRRHGPGAYIAPSFAVAEAHESVPWITGRIRVAHLPIEAKALPVRGPAGSGAFTYGYIGHLSVEKGLPTLLTAFDELAADGARLLVAGAGELEGDVAGRGVTALGWLEGAGLESFWSSIDCLVVPSQWAEPGGLVAVEARAHGLPVVAARSGGLVEHVEERSAPLLFTPGDVDALRRSMRLVAADPTAYRPAPTADWPDWAEHVARVEEVYAGVRR